MRRNAKVLLTLTAAAVVVLLITQPSDSPYDEFISRGGGRSIGITLPLVTSSSPPLLKQRDVNPHGALLLSQGLHTTVTTTAARYNVPDCSFESKGSWEFPGGNHSLPPRWQPDPQVVPRRSHGGKETTRESGGVEDGENGKHSKARSPPKCQFHRFSQADAVRCLEGKFILFYGNSNTRTLFTALESLLKNQPQLSRLVAKQKCDNSKHNHSCGMIIEPNATAVDERLRPATATAQADEHQNSRPLSPADIQKLKTHLPIKLYYWGYIKDVFDSSLEVKMQHHRGADAIITNSQLNVVQATPVDAELIASHTRGMHSWNAFASTFPKSQEHRNRTGSPSFFWHSTTYVCPNQPHFRRYRYQKKFWANRNPHETNAVIKRSNDFISGNVDPQKIAVIDGAAMVSLIFEQRTAGEQLLCPHYDDPLHHRFLDSQIVQVFLNRFCPLVPRPL